MSLPQETLARDEDVRWSVGDVAAAVGAGTVVGIALSAVTFLILSGTGVSESVAFFLLGTEVYAGVAVMAWVLVIKRREVTWAEAGFRPVRPSAIVWMVPLTLGVLIVNGLVAQITSEFFGRVPNAEDQLSVGPAPLSIVDLICLLIVVAVVAPVVEEFIFRGLLYRSSRARWGIPVASLISALTFSLLHFIPLLIAVFFVFGLILTAVAQRYDSIYPAIALHALNNAVSIGLLFVAR